MLYIFDSAEKLLSILPRDNILEAIHKEVLNGENIFRFVMSASDINAEYVREGNLVAFRDLDAYWQVFEIKNITDVHSEIFTRTAYCEHIFYELLDDIVEDKRPSADATAALAGMLENTRWQAGIIDDLGVSRTSAYYISALEAVQNVANAWGGELRWRCVITGGVITRYVDLLAQRGSSTGKQFVYSKDILSIEREADSSSVVTALYGRGKGVELESGGYGRRLTFADVVAADKPAGQEWVGNSDALEMWGRNGRHRFDVFIDEEETDAEKLLEKTRIELTKRITPRVTYRMNVVVLEELAEYEYEKVRIGDLVIVVDREFNPRLLVSARIIEFERDLLDISNANIILGSFAPTIVEATIGTQRRVNDMANRPFNTKWLDGKISVLQNAIESAMSNWWTDENGNLIFEAQDGLSAMKLAGEGFAIANSKTGEAWNWRTFGDGTGFTADLITAGMIDAALVQIGHATTFAPGYDPSLIEGAASMGVDSDCVGLWHFDGSLNSHKGVAAIGDSIFDAGCFGQAVQVEEGTTNLLTANQSSVETNLIGFNVYNANDTITRDTTEKWQGLASIKCVTISTSTGYWLTFSAVNGLTYTFSAYVKPTTIGNIYTTMDGACASTYLYNYDLPTDKWTRIMCTVTATSTGTIYIFIRSTTALTWYTDGLQIEQKDHATSWVLGGTTRLGVLKMPTTDTAISQGVISLRVKNLSTSANGSVLVDLPTASINYTNKVIDGSITSLTNWNNTGTLITNDGAIGSTCVEYGYAWECYQNFTNRLTNGQHYFISAYGKVVSGAGTPRISYTGMTPQNIYGSNNASWHRFGDKVSVTDASQIEFRLLYGAADGGTARFDGIMVIEITADEYNNLTFDELMVKYPYVDTSGTTVGDPAISCGISNVAGHEGEVCITDNVTTVYGPNKSTLTAWDSISLAWKPDRLSLVVNDEEACYIENPGLPTAFGSYVYIGTDRNGANSINTLVDELRIDKVYREVNTRTGWHKAGTPFYTSEDMKQLPGYLRAETDGYKVYDSSNALRVLIGSWMQDMVRKYGIKIIGGELYSSFIQTGEEGETRGIIKIDRKFLPEYPGYSWGNIIFNNQHGNVQMEISSEGNQPQIYFYDNGTPIGEIRVRTLLDTAELFIRNEKGIDLRSEIGGSITIGKTSSPTSNAGIRAYSSDRVVLESPNVVSLYGKGAGSRAQVNGYEVVIVGNNVYITGATEVAGNLRVLGSIEKTGELNYIEPTKDYGTRLLNAVEAPEFKYVDMGRTRLEGGEATVYIDPILLQCIEPDTDLTPWLFKTEVYGKGEDIRVIEWGENYFKVKESNGGESNRSFGWWFYATRINYAGIRLMEWRL